MENKKILLLDSEKNVLLSYQTVLEEEGYQVDIATIEKVALEKLLIHNFSVLITEFFLKGKNTINLVKQAKQNHPEIYIIMITAALLNQNVYEELISVGVDDCFTKPFPPKGLLSNINKGLKRRELMLENVQLEKRLKHMDNLFSSDPLYSGEYKIICNNLYFHKRLQYEIIRAKRYNHQFSLVLFDINSSSNENKPLELENRQNISNEVSNILLKNTRQTDIITRFNGSFAIILVETPNGGSKILTRRLQEQISKTSLVKETSLFQNIKFDYASYPEQSEFIHKWVSKAEKKCNNKILP